MDVLVPELYFAIEKVGVLFACVTCDGISYHNR